MITLRRKQVTATAVCGEMLINGAHYGYTLERPYQDPEHPCIPVGRYPVQVRYSNHFQRDMVHIDNVPRRSGILVHGGNHVTDSLGCVLLGAVQNLQLSYVGQCADLVQGLINYVDSHNEEEFEVIDDTEVQP